MTNYVNDFPEGFFFIRCKAKPMALDVYGGGMLVSPPAFVCLNTTPFPQLLFLLRENGHIVLTIAMQERL